MKKRLVNAILAFVISVSFIPISSANAQTVSQSSPASLLILGDSIAAGYGLSAGFQSYGQQLAQALGLSGSKYINLAHNGDVSADLLTKISDPANANYIRSADTIEISIGGNDILNPFFTSVKAAIGHPDERNDQLLPAIASNPAITLAEISATMQNTSTQTQFSVALKNFEANLPKIVEMIRSINPKTHIYIQTVYNPFSGLAGADSLSSSAESILGTLNASIVENSSSEHYSAVDIHNIFSGKAAAYTNMKQFDVHPNAAGHSAIFNALYTQITGNIYNSITLDTKSYQMPVGGCYQIGVKLTGNKAALVKVCSTNDKIAAVARMKNGNVQVTGKGVGTAYVMFNVCDGKGRSLSHASVRVDVKIRTSTSGDSTRQIGKF